MKIMSTLLLTILIFSVINYSNPSSYASNKIPKQYIVVLKDNIDNPKLISDELAHKYNITKEHIYESALNGFSAKMSLDKLNKIKNDPRVQFVEQDVVVEAFQLQTQVIPPGVDRIDADHNLKADIDNVDNRIDVDIAIIDSGIDLDHPDLNVIEDVSFVKKVKTGDDDNGHGTHVAGIAAALDNNYGIVGVTPGARLYAVKVLDKDGLGSISQLVAGIDWVTKNSKQIDVANISLGCLCHSISLQKAIQKSVDRGIIFVVAAGNGSTDASNFEPASYDEVISVSAIVDTDGKCGSLGTTTESGNDDNFASFSNFGNVIDIAAPGGNILSTFKDGSYNTMSGTSMASPHVTGAVALYLHDKARDLNTDGKMNSIDVIVARNAILSSAVTQNTLCDITLGDGNGGFSGDVDSFAEPIIYAKNL